MIEIIVNIELEFCQKNLFQKPLAPLAEDVYEDEDPLVCSDFVEKLS